LITKKALLLIGSPRGFESTSNSLGSYLLCKLQSGGYTVGKIHIQTALHNQVKEAKMLSEVVDSDILVLAFPLFIDCLPAPVILALEKIAEYKKASSTFKRSRVLAIVNNGFPDSSQNATAIAICRQFAKETDLEWAGGLMLGEGAMINGVPLEKAPMTKNIKKALDLAADDLLQGRAISETAFELMAKPAIPKFLYTLVGNRGWKSMAKKYGAQKKLRNRPYK
jgi:hypothetical protein